MILKSKFLVFIGLNVFVTIILLFHESFLTELDKYLMPNSAELCKEASHSLRKFTKKSDRSPSSFIEI